MSETRWNDSGRHLAVWMGAQGSPEDPWPVESHDEGCPGSWYRCAWYASVMRYRGPLGRTVTDPLVLEALDYAETQERAAAEHR